MDRVGCEVLGSPLERLRGWWWGGGEGEGEESEGEQGEKGGRSQNGRGWRTQAGDVICDGGRARLRAPAATTRL